MEAGLSLGSNLGNRFENLRQARIAILQLPGCRLLAQSPVYETDPVDVPSEFQDLPFLNAVLIVEWAGAAEALAAAAHDIENQLGRQRGPTQNAPRLIDIDLLYGGNEIIRTATLTLPHPRWSERRFVVQPLADVRPHLLLPESDCTVRKQLDRLPPGPAVVIYQPPGHTNQSGLD
jgi:2-amino-4-hydroxy-6-hydroxymethyldihydropteridine diphosphokinase